VISNVWHISFPLFILFDAENNEFHNETKLLQSIPHEITIRQSPFRSSEFQVILPNSDPQSITRKSIPKLRKEIRRQLGEDIDLISCGQFVFNF
jgi:hypothetical protein